MTAPTRNEPDTGAGQAREAPVQWLALLGVAALLRAHELASPLWYDEIVTLVEYVRLSPSEILTTYPPRGPPPGSQGLKLNLIRAFCS